MFKLLRRISGSITTRLDREWNDDATSNAPQVGRKRRMSDDDDEPYSSVSSKRARGSPDAIAEEPETDSSQPSTTPTGPETADVKEIRKGVKEVELVEKEKTDKEDPPKVNGTAEELPSITRKESEHEEQDVAAEPSSSTTSSTSATADAEASEGSHADEKEATTVPPPVTENDVEAEVTSSTSTQDNTELKDGSSIASTPELKTEPAKSTQHIADAPNDDSQDAVGEDE
ncbi:hypothetical protein BD410DRAFT_900181 [Rickenella mellea]|uniref:Uncharacterized protein n=1 Tax=Rickenella mellea TaxID=50990 RepID=A0A4Y7PVQ4_9AGAM|nr:hypothetical protein BD410DRAFT_900181 [Rickenella mellea]